MTKHTFKQSYEKGRIGEQKVIDFLESKNYEITEILTHEQQKLFGFDFYVKTPKGDTFKVEVKTEYAVENTGNIYYETMSGNNLGWCLTVPDDVYIIYYIPHLDKLYGLYGKTLKSINYLAFKTKQCYNATFQATGHIIPLTHFLTFCKELN